LRKIPSGDFEKFLRLVDEELAEPFTTIVVGGAAIGIVQPPYEYEDRLRPLPIRGLKRLQILVPEAHDLALMKVARGEAHDLEAIEEIHRILPLSLATLVSRYEESRPQFIGHPANLKLSFLALVARLFGEEEARRVDREIR
jgi:hypothetical protein